MKKTMFFFSLFVLFLSFFYLIPKNVPQIYAETNEVKLLDDAKSGILIEYQTGKVLYAQNAHERRAPASMTKIMSIYLIADAIKANKIRLTDMVVASAHAASYGGSQIFLAENEQMSVEDLFKAMVIASANDATVALAEAVSGSEERFVQQMNEKVKALGLKNTAFTDPTGLASFSEGHYSTAYDMAMIAQALLKDHGDLVLKYSKIYIDYLRKGTDKEFELVNTNKLVYFDQEIDGLKTGWTQESGYNLTATKLKDKMRLISVVMGCSSSTIRNNETRKLLNYGYSMYELQEYKPANLKVGEYESIYLQPEKVAVMTKDAVYFVVPKGQRVEGLREEFNYHLTRQSYKPGDVIGEYRIIKDGDVVYKVDLIVNQEIERAGFLQLFIRTMKRVFIG